MRYQEEIHDCRSRYRVLCIGRRGGKTELALNELITKCVTEPGLYWYVAPFYNQAKTIAWIRLKDLLQNAQDEWKYNEQELYAEHLPTGGRIELRGADKEERLLGVGLKGVVLDECAMLRETVWTRIIRPMLADNQGWALFISTPKGLNWFYDIFQNKGDNWKSWNFPTTVNHYIPEEEILEAKKDLPETLYRQEFLAEFIADELGVFKRVRSCIVGETQPPKEGRFYVIGVDLAKLVDFTVLIVIDTVDRHVVALERFTDISWREQKIKIQALANRYNNALCIIDSTGVGEPIFEDLSISNVSCESFKFNAGSKKQLIENAQIAIEQRQITFPRIDVLIQELMQYEYVTTDKGNIGYNAPHGKHDDCVISLCLGLWGIRTQLKEAQTIHQQIQIYSGLDKEGRGEVVLPEDNELNISGY